MSCKLTVFLVDGCDVILLCVFFRSWSVPLQGSCTPAGAETTRFDLQYQNCDDRICIIQAGWRSIMMPCCVCVCVCVFGSTRSWLTWGFGCEMQSPPWRRTPCSWYPPWWSGRQRETDTHWCRRTHTSTRRWAFFFLKLPLGVFCHLFLSQRNWCPVSWLHPHAESSANQVEPLDSKVTEDDTSNLPTCYTLDDVLFMSVSCVSSTGSSSHAVALSRDVDQLQEIKKRVDVLPLGR